MRIYRAGTSAVDGHILALQGAASFVVQARLAQFARRRIAEGVRVAGCVEEFSGAPGTGCADRSLRDIVSGRSFAIGQDLGSGSTACHLDAAGVACACQSVLETIEQGCELVVLAKFGKLEAERSGLVDAFAAAVSRSVPIVTSVAPSFSHAWSAYAGDLSRYATPDDGVLESWWRDMQIDRTHRAA